MKIEKYKKINENKYRITLDNGTIIDTYEDVIVKNNLLYKKEIDLNLLKEIETDNEYQEAYNMALKYMGETWIMFCFCIFRLALANYNVLTDRFDI